MMIENYLHKIGEMFTCQILGLMVYGIVIVLGGSGLFAAACGIGAGHMLTRKIGKREKLRYINREAL